ncbi:hypothetical protein ABZP36_015925 [Zizania latifolia]
MEMLGLRRCVRELSAIASTSVAYRRAGSGGNPRKTPKPRWVLTPVRLITFASAAPSRSALGPRRSSRLNIDLLPFLYDEGNLNDVHDN